MLDQREHIPALSIRRSVGANCSVELSQSAPAARPDLELKRRFVATHVYLHPPVSALAGLGVGGPRRLWDWTLRKGEAGDQC